MRKTTRARLFYLAVFALLGSGHAAGQSHIDSDRSIHTQSRSKFSDPDACAVSSSNSPSSSPHAAVQPPPSERYVVPVPIPIFTFRRCRTGTSAKRSKIEPNALVSDACASYASLDGLNEHLAPHVRTLTHDTDFFSYYRLNLYNKVCPFWSDEDGMCGNIACAVHTLDDESEIPPIWRAEELSKLQGPKAEHPTRQKQKESQQRPLSGSLGDDVGESCVVEYDDECDDRDYCIPEDESATGKGDYVSLVDNPERFTGYGGPSAHQVWEAIYRENCFSKPKSGLVASRSTNVDISKAEPGAVLKAKADVKGQAAAAHDLREVMRSARENAALQAASSSFQDTSGIFDLELDDQCLEKRVFHRIISGMHASISTHLCHDYLDQQTGTWGPNLTCYEERLHTHPERVSNLYFNYALVLRAVGKLRHRLRAYTFCTGDVEADLETKTRVAALADAIPRAGRDVFDESIMFNTGEGVELKEDFRARFRNVSRIMDCVGCDKCRLWGKVQTAGYGTALKVLFEFDDGQGADQGETLRRTELVALINTLDKISGALSAIAEFERLIEERDGAGQATGQTVSEGQVVKTEQNAQEEARARARHMRELAEEYDDNTPLADQTVGEIFREEWNKVWGAYVWVIKQWLSLPGQAFDLFVVEMSRFWDFWIGSPVKPRQWGFSMPGPGHDET